MSIEIIRLYYNFEVFLQFIRDNYLFNSRIMKSLFNINYSLIISFTLWKMIPKISHY